MIEFGVLLDTSTPNTNKPRTCRNNRIFLPLRLSILGSRSGHSFLLSCDQPVEWVQAARHTPPGADICAWAHQHLLASPGALVIRGGSVFRIPTLVPARRPEGGCVFLTSLDRCAIHGIAPFGCAFFDDHMETAEADRRSRRGLQAVLEAWRSGSLYAQLWLVLQEAGRQAPPPEVCRRQLRQAREQQQPP